MPLIAKRPTDRFLCEMVTKFYEEAYDYSGYLQISADEWVKNRIRETKLNFRDKNRALELVQD